MIEHTETSNRSGDVDVRVTNVYCDASKDMTFTSERVNTVIASKPRGLRKVKTNEDSDENKFFVKGYN